MTGAPLLQHHATFGDEPRRIPSLDGLRAISVSLVVASHLLWHPDFISFQPIYAQWLAPLGHLGVRVFFVISGFLITGLLLRELEATGQIALGKFYFRRVLRIFPAYYCYVLLGLAAQVLGWVSLTTGDLVSAATYTVNYHPEASWYIGHAWSLSVEEQFYLLWPAVLVVLGRRRGLGVALAVVVLCPLIRLSIWYLWPSLLEYQIGYRFETVADAIAVGGILAGTQHWLVQQRSYQALLTSRLFPLVPIAVCLASVLPQSSRASLLLGIPLQNIGIAACVARSMTAHRGRTGRVLNSKPMVFVGTISYSIYLWQQPFLNPHSSAAVCRFPLNLLLVGAAALGSYYLVERPALRLRQRLEPRFFAPRPRDVRHDTDKVVAKAAQGSSRPK